jgi:O-antigen/teichoic acid export membrane protein
MVVTKLIGFCIYIFVARVLTTVELGNFTYAFTVIGFLLPFLGFGSYQSLVYYGAGLKTVEEKQHLFRYAFRNGIILSSVMAAILVLFSGFITQNQPNSQFLLIVLSLHLITFTLVEFIRNYTRLIDRNDLFAKSEIAYNILLFILIALGCWVLKVQGFAWAYAISPLIIGLFYFQRLKFSVFSKGQITIQTKEFWKYGAFVSLGAVAAKLLYGVDIITIGNVLEAPIGMNSEQIESYRSSQQAVYKICSLIPIATFILPLAFMTTDFVKLAEMKSDKSFLWNYILNLWKFLIPIALLIFGILHFGGQWILILFGKKYIANEHLLSIFGLAVLGAFTLRIPFGNMLSAVGKANWNACISFIMLAINIPLNYFWVKESGIEGAAWATTVLIWLSGIINLLVFRCYKCTK